MRALAVSALLLYVAGGAQAQGIDPAVAREYFREAETAAAGLGVWGRALYGPMILVNADTREAVANQRDAAGLLQARDGVWVGRFPDAIGVFNGAIEWSGTRWTLLRWPLPLGRYERARLMTHELFHRIQPALGFSGSNPGNTHLDTESARRSLRLEWRALQAALASTGEERVAAIADALAFRAARQRAFATGYREEIALEMNEGLAEYTGVRAAIPEPARAGWVLRLIDNADARARSESVVRNFAYTSGPAYGLLLDAADPQWHRSLTDSTDLGALIAAAYRVAPAAAPRGERYGAGAVAREEAAREAERVARDVAFRKRFVDGPTLFLPTLTKFSFTFDPNAVAPFDPHGTVYLTTQVQDEWGELTVSSGGALFVREQGRIVRVVIPAQADGYELKLAEGWEIAGGTVRRKQE